MDLEKEDEEAAMKVCDADGSGEVVFSEFKGMMVQKMAENQKSLLSSEDMLVQSLSLSLLAYPLLFSCNRFSYLVTASLIL